MTVHSLAQRAYSEAAAPTRTPRGTEYDVMARVTHRLIAGARKGRKGFAELSRAIHDNRQLWTILAADVADTANPLPQDLRARIFYLAEFTQVHSRKVLRREATVAPLIEVNTAVMRGLRKDGGA
ncbi:flagellar biosynthesis regulator FlaF [Pseudooceanicola onchidii]|uniref:flagellar biosynthesis regulator FlaF n=1 Tax=Pseudooceanicola onchidii TaxID=2562279 RepID=UPI0010A9FDCB|nr:flagellar biosynthesis regulator FlaF [Pseudooceanicola onchidii]